MLTPDKIKNKEFHTSGKGSYRSEEVDDFMNEVYTSYEKVFRENGEIIKKMSLLANKVEEYKKDEDSLRQALLSAQKLADQITAEAKENAEKQILGNACFRTFAQLKPHQRREQKQHGVRNFGHRHVGVAREVGEDREHGGKHQAAETSAEFTSDGEGC